MMRGANHHDRKKGRVPRKTVASRCAHRAACAKLCASCISQASHHVMQLPLPNCFLPRCFAAPPQHHCFRRRPAAEASHLQTWWGISSPHTHEVGPFLATLTHSLTRSEAVRLPHLISRRHCWHRSCASCLTSSFKHDTCQGFRV
jgi:hypothetical protein